MALPNTPDKFWKKVDRRTSEECWEWMGHTTNGKVGTHGSLRYNGKQWVASRLAYILTFGDIPDELEVCHTCDNPPCCNPSHLWLGTHRENMRDSIAKGRFKGTKNILVVKVGEDTSGHILTNEQVLEIRKLCSLGHPQKWIAQQFGIARSTVSWIKTGRSWTHLIKDSTSQSESDPDVPSPNEP